MIWRTIRKEIILIFCEGLTIRFTDRSTISLPYCLLVRPLEGSIVEVRDRTGAGMGADERSVKTNKKHSKPQGISNELNYLYDFGVRPVCRGLMKNSSLWGNWQPRNRMSLPKFRSKNCLFRTEWCHGAEVLLLFQALLYVW